MSVPPSQATLSILGTPIGNLGDMTFRAVEILKTADLVLCEDTRHTKNLLDHYQLHPKKLRSFHQHTSPEQLQRLVADILGVVNTVYVSDAGTPGVSDPGSVLVAACLTAGVVVNPIPGPSALTAIISVAGIDISKFNFLGFLPHKKGRAKILHSLVEATHPTIFYESKYRIRKMLEFLAENHPELKLIIGNELTKKFERIWRGTAVEILPVLVEKGEFVVISYMA